MNEWIFDELHKKNTNIAPVAAELFSSAWCNLDCKYCYIPKNDKIKDRHDKIIEEVKKVDPIIDRLKKVFGENLEIISHWGSEPTLTIKYFNNFYKKAIAEFPKLKKISLSSNFSTNINNLSNFIKNLSQDRIFDIYIQISLDGPYWITDYNRRNGKTDIIISNILKLLENLNSCDFNHNIHMNFKPTWSIDNINYMLNNDKIEDYYIFFDNLISNMIKINKNKNVNIYPNSCNPTIVCIDNYSSEDGKKFFELYSKIIKINNKFYNINPDISYYHNFKKFFTVLIDEFWIKQRMFTCSAGDTQLGISNDNLMHMCHQSFYYEYQDLMLSDNDRILSKTDNDNVCNNRINNVYNSIPSIYDEKNKILYSQYKNRAFHDFANLKLQLAMSIIKEMADCGQISKCYNDDNMAKILALFCIQRHSCPVSSLENYGSLFVYTHSYFRLFGNGIVEDFVERIKNEL